MNRSISIAVLVLSLAGIAGPPRTARADAPPPSASTQNVLEIYQEANQLYDAGQLPQAEARYREAWAIRKSYDIASNLGALELDLHKPARAAEFLTFAVQQFPANGSEKTLAALRGRLDKARSLSCVLRVQVDQPGADIYIDGVFIGRAPLAEELFVEPGQRTIAASLGKQRDQQIITAKEGAAQTLSFKVTPTAPPAAVPTPTARSRTPGIVAGAAGLVGLGVGGALIVLAEASRTDAKNLHDSIAATPGGCSARSADCVKLRDTTAHADQFGNAGIGVLVTGGVLVAASVTYLLWPTSKAAPATNDASRAKSARSLPTIRASVGAAPTGGGLTLVGSF